MSKWRYILFAVSLMILDQATKYWAYNALTPYQPVRVLPFMNWTLAYNPGAAFSFLSQTGDWHLWFLPALSLAMSGLLLAWLIKTPLAAKMQLTGIALILGGALGNLVDRAVFGEVIDFIQLYYRHFYWPVFNVADTAICIGAILLVIDLYKNPGSQRP